MAFELLALYMFMVENLDNTERQNKESNPFRINNPSKYASEFFPLTCIYNLKIQMETCYEVFLFNKILCMFLMPLSNS